MLKIVKNRAVIYPVIVYVIAVICFQGFNWDYYVANYWYELQGHDWLLKKHWLTQSVIHKGGHDTAIVLYLVIIVLYITSFKHSTLKPYHFGLKYLVISLLVGALSISLLKQLLTVDCPWNIIDFGGTRQYEHWYQSILFSSQEGMSHCFPSGHASSAYTYFALYFFAKRYCATKAYLILSLVIFTGITFGLAQQLRGAHFVSHDLTSALLCWFISYGIWQIMTKKIPQHL
jgi:membrane-associated PAP2 superfamily phosphatase